MIMWNYKLSICIYILLRNEKIQFLVSYVKYGLGSRHVNYVVVSALPYLYNSPKRIAQKYTFSDIYNKKS